MLDWNIHPLARQPSYVPRRPSHRSWKHCGQGNRVLNIIWWPTKLNWCYGYQWISLRSHPLLFFFLFLFLFDEVDKPPICPCSGPIGVAQGQGHNRPSFFPLSLLASTHNLLTSPATHFIHFNCGGNGNRIPCRSWATAPVFPTWLFTTTSKTVSDTAAILRGSRLRDMLPLSKRK